MGEARDKYQSQCPDFFKLVDEPDERKGWFKVTKRVLDDHCLMYLLSGCAAGLPAAGLSAPLSQCPSLTVLLSHIAPLSVLLSHAAGLLWVLLRAILLTGLPPSNGCRKVQGVHEAG
jgi:hypothetical protein